MEKIILAHFSFSGDFRNLSLSSNSAVDLEHFIEGYYKSTQSLYFLDECVYQRNFFYDITFKEGIYYNKKEEGFWFYRLILGGHTLEGIYRNGKKDGLWVCYCKNGRRYSESFYENGLIDPVYARYYETGERDTRIRFPWKPDSQSGGTTDSRDSLEGYPRGFEELEDY